MTRMMTALCLGVASMALAAPAFAQSKGDWTLGVGVVNVNPKSDNGTLAGAAADIDDATALQFTAEYFVADNIGIELLAASPFEHDVNLAGIGFAGSVKQLPPTLSVKYHFPTQSNFKPFVGLGINYTTFFEEESPLGTLELDDSFGLAATVGAEWLVGDSAAVRLDVRYIKIDSDVSLNGANIGKAEIDPVTVGLAYVHRF